MNQDQQAEMVLVKQAQSNLQSFAILYERYFTKIYKFFHFRLRDDMEAQDLTSETFTKAVQKLNSFQDQGYAFSAWLFRIAHNILVDYFRDKNFHKEVSLDEVENTADLAIELDISLIDKKEAIEDVRKIIATLPALHQDIWALKLSSDMSNKDIAETLKISPNNVNVILFRSIQVIKDKLKRYQF